MTLMAAGTAMSAYGKVREGQAAAKAGKYNRDAAYAEAESLDIQAGQEVAAGSIENTRIAARMREILAEQQAAAASGGGNSLDASVVAIKNEAATTSILDQMRVMAAAQERAQQIKHGAQVTRSGGDYALAQGREARRASYIGAATTLVQGAASWKSMFGAGGGTTGAATTSSGPTKYSVTAGNNRAPSR